MEQHPVPQNITGFQFKLVGDMTIRQFSYLVAGAIVSVFLYNSHIISLIKWPLLICSFGAGFAFAFLPIEERPLDRWVINFIKSIYRPTQFIWKKGAKKPDFLSVSYAPIEITQTVEKTPFSKAKNVENFLSTLPNTAQDVDQKENQSLKDISTLLGVVTPPNPAPPPIHQPQISINPSSNNTLPPFRIRPIGDQKGQENAEETASKDTVLKDPSQPVTVIFQNETNKLEPPPQAIPTTSPVLNPTPNGQPKTPFKIAPPPPIQKIKIPEPVPVPPSEAEKQGGLALDIEDALNKAQAQEIDRLRKESTDLKNELGLKKNPPPIPIPPIEKPLPKAPDELNRVVIPSIPKEEIQKAQQEELTALKQEIEKLKTANELIAREKELTEEKFHEEEKMLDAEKQKQAMTITELMKVREDQRKQKEEVAHEEEERIENKITQATSANQELISQIDTLKQQMSVLQAETAKKGQDEENIRKTVSELERQLKQAQIEKEIATQELARLRKEQHELKVAPIKPAPAETNIPPTTPRVRFASPKTAKEAGLPIITQVPNAVNGIVKDAENTFLENAIVIIKDHEDNPVRALKTNRLGQFLAATPLPNGPYTIEIEKSGLNFDIIEISLNSTPVPPIEIRAKTENIAPPPPNH